MKRAAWLASLVAVAALASAGCAFQVAGQGQDEQQVGSTSQGLNQDQNSPGQRSTNSVSGSDDGTGSSQAAGDNPGAKPTPDPWRTLLTPTKPTPDPWRPDDTTSATDGSQSGGDPGSTSTTTTQSINASAR